MTTHRKSVAMLITLSLTFVVSQAADDQSTDAALAGDWHGESTCVVKPSGCHDEDSLYHVAKIPEKPGRFSMKLDKIVGGKPVTMGTVECSYEATTQSLSCSWERGSFLFTVHGDQMNGVMKVEGGRVWRKLSLKKIS
jgi:hypothetical protein